MCETAARMCSVAARKRMTRMDTPADDGADRISVGWDSCPQRSQSLRSEAYCDQHWYDFEQAEIFSRSWQWVCHSEKLAEPGSFLTETVAGNPICVVRGADGELRAFFNVCRHRAHELLSGEGRVSRIMCPYHAWTYDLTGRLVRAPHTDGLEGFSMNEICLARIQAEEFGGFVYVNLDAGARPLAEQAGTLEDEIRHWAPDVERLTFAHRLTYDIRANWKNVVDNFLECYHCPVAHRDSAPLSTWTPTGSRRTASGQATWLRPASGRIPHTPSRARRSGTMRYGGCGRTPASCAIPPGELHRDADHPGRCRKDAGDLRLLS